MVLGLVFKKVLIETLWNVKRLYQVDFVEKNLVLIETLWNVKCKFRSEDNNFLVCFNRNIVECKGVICTVNNRIIGF